MRKIFTFKNVFISLVSFIGLILFLRLVQVTYDSFFFSEARAPYLQSMTDHSVIIKWQTAEPTVSIVRYGESYDRLEFKETDLEMKREHEIQLTGLKANTLYYYFIPQLYEKTRERWFQTFAVQQKPTRLWILGDSGKAGEDQQAVKRSALSWMQNNPKSNAENNIDLWLLLGDIAYRSGTQKQFQKALFDAYPNIIKNNSIWPVYGNHDDRRWAYFDIFSLPTQGESGGVASQTEHYYSIDFANVHLLMLDSQASSLESDGEMAQWIKQDLAHTNADWIIAAVHHPPYTDGSHDSDNVKDSGGRMQAMRENIVPLLEQGGVDVVLAGHSHGFERSDLMRCHYQESAQFSAQHHVLQQSQEATYQKQGQGTLYVVTGSAAKLDQADYKHPALPHSHAELGSLIIDIKGKQLTGHFINDAAEEVDFFQINKLSSVVNSEPCPVN